MSLAFAGNLDRFNLLVHEVLLLAIAHVLAFEEVKMIAREEVQLVLHLPDLGLFDLSFSDRKWISFAFCLT